MSAGTVVCVAPLLGIVLYLAWLAVDQYADDAGVWWRQR